MGQIPIQEETFLMEDLRQMCILQDYDLDTWFDYMKGFDTFCMDGGNIEQCSERAIANLGMNWEKIEKCVDKSFDKPGDKCKTNSFFDREFKAMRNDTLYLIPSITINNMTYRGNLFPPVAIFEAICYSFEDFPQPCKDMFDPDVYVNPLKPIEKGELPGGSTTTLIVATGIFLIFFAFFAVCCYKRYIKREMSRQMMKEVDVAVAQYMAFKDTDEEPKDTSRLV